LVSGPDNFYWESTIENFTAEKNQQLHSCQQIIKINSNDILFSDILY